MQKHRELTLRRLENFRHRLLSKLYPDRVAVTLAAYEAPGRIAWSEALKGSYRPIRLGHSFGPPWSTHWVKVEFEIPERWRGGEVHFRWDSSSEAAIWRDGVVLRGLSTGKHTSEVLTPQAEGGERGILYVEVACNELLGILDPERIIDGDVYRELGRLKLAEIALFDRPAWDLLWDFTVLAEAAAALAPDSPRAGQALRAADEFVNLCDPEDPATWPEARRTAASFLGERNGTAPHNVSAVGHAHLDTAWLWPVAETKRKCCRSLATAVSLAGRYPWYRFAWSQAQQWEWVKEEFPELYARVREKIETGSILPLGAAWVEPDLNLPSGESLVRQFLYGQRFFEKEFGSVSPVFWIPDSFGFPAQLPQIMRSAEVRWFLTQKISWSQFNSLPHHTFLWEGIDGSRVLTHFPPADTYNGTCEVKEILYSVGNYKDHDRSRESLYVFGFGDGGGGPTEEMLERLRRMRDVDGLPRVECRSPEEFFRRLEADARGLAVWVGELYLELHRGTYTTHAEVKRYNRKSELLLRDVELLWTVLDRTNYPKEELDRVWKLVLLNQFHDILPGSSIKEVYEDARVHYEDILSSLSGLRDKALRKAAGAGGERLLAVNTLSFARREVADPPAGLRGVTDPSPVIAAAPPMGYAVAEPQGPKENEWVRAGETKKGFFLENGMIKAEFDRAGRLRSLFDKRAARELVPASARGNNLVLFDDDPVDYDAWDVDIFHFEKRKEVPPALSIEIREQGPLRASLRIEFGLGSRSRLETVVRITALSARLDFLCRAVWHERRKFLKVEFPWNISSLNAAYEIQFGYLERPTHWNTSWDMARFEVCGHRWADLSEPDYGVALLNDSKYGYGVRGNVMRLSLLRSPLAPDPEADRGEHEFTYAVFPHPGSLTEGRVIEEAMSLNSPLILKPAGGSPGETSWFRTDRPGIMIDTVKRAEDSQAVVLRIYEAYGTRGRVRLKSAFPIRRAVRCNLLERREEPAAFDAEGVTLDLRPFEIVTLKLDL